MKEEKLKKKNLTTSSSAFEPPSTGSIGAGPRFSTGLHRAICTTTHIVTMETKIFQAILFWNVMMTNCKFTSKCAAVEPKTRSSHTVWSKLHMYTKLTPLGYFCYYLNENVINGEGALCHLSLEFATVSESSRQQRWGWRRLYIYLPSIRRRKKYHKVYTLTKIIHTPGLTKWYIFRSAADNQCQLSHSCCENHSEIILKRKTGCSTCSVYRWAVESKSIFDWLKCL